MIEINVVNEYLALHLRADFWGGLTEEKKEESLKQAVDDVCFYLGIVEVDPLRIFQLCAVSEQAVFLADSKSVEMSSSKLAPRALTFLEREIELI